MKNLAFGGRGIAGAGIKQARAMNSSRIPVVKQILPLMQIWFWSNLFVGWSSLVGVPRTIRDIRHLARQRPLRKGSLETYSERIDICLRRLPFLFLRRRQKCLIRGLLLYFYGKRLQFDIRLRFGNKLENGSLKTHCWITEKEAIRFEVEQAINDFVVMVEYS